jgi:hypothetical protein
MLRSEQMLKTTRFALILGLAGAAAGLPSMAVAQNDNDSDVAAAIRFQKAEDAAAARQARLEARGGESNSADRMAQPPASKSTPSASAQKEPGVEAALRFQKAEDAAAARQARIEGSGAGDESSADRMAVAPTAKSKIVKGAARKNPPAQHNPQ